MTGEGIVVSVSNGEAVVRISKSSACGHDCASCGACSNPSYEMAVLNPVGAKAGDTVVIESQSSKILGLSFLLYMLPVFLMIVATFVCEAYSLGLYSILIFVCLFSAWFLLIRYTNKRLKIQNIAVKIVNHSQKD